MFLISYYAAGMEAPSLFQDSRCSDRGFHNSGFYMSKSKLDVLTICDLCVFTYSRLRTLRVVIISSETFFLLKRLNV